MFYRRKCAVLVVWIMALCMTACGKDESYRIIKLTDMNGEVSYTRDEETEDVYENMNFESGDEVETEEESRAQLTLDSDKILTMGAETTILLEAEGDEEDSKTRIKLEKGEITCEIKNALSSGALYEVETSNAIIGVRGTLFYVKESKDRTIVYCETGKVEITLDNNTSQTISAKEAVVIEDDIITPALPVDIVDEVSAEFIPDLPGLEDVVEDIGTIGGSEEEVIYENDTDQWWDDWELVEVVEGKIEPMPADAEVSEVSSAVYPYTVFDETKNSYKHYDENQILRTERRIFDSYYIDYEYQLIEGIPLWATEDHVRDGETFYKCYYSFAASNGAHYIAKRSDNGDYYAINPNEFESSEFGSSIAPGVGYEFYVIKKGDNEDVTERYWLQIDVREDNTYTITVYRI